MKKEKGAVALRKCGGPYLNIAAIYIMHGSVRAVPVRIATATPRQTSAKKQ